jgi:hypothetical protein
MEKFISNESKLSFNDTRNNFDSGIDKTLLKIEVFVMALEFVLALVGNLIVILTLLLRRYIKTKASFEHSSSNTNQNTLKQSTGNTASCGASVGQNRSRKSRRLTRMNFFILNLSIADAYVSLGNILTMMLWRMNNNLFYGGDLACRLVVYFQLVSVYYSTYVLATMTIDRFEAVCKPLGGLNWSKKRGSYYILVSFLLAHLQGVPQVVFFALRDVFAFGAWVKTCYAKFEPQWLMYAYVLYTCFMQFVIPLCIIIVCQATISVKVFNNRNAIARSNFKNNTINTRKSTNYNANGLDRDDHSDAARKGLLPTRRASDEININNNNNNLTVSSPLSNASSEFDFKSTSEMRNSVLNKSFQEEYQLEQMIKVDAGKKDLPPSFRQHCSKNLSKSKLKTIKLTLTVIILYIICSTPYYVGLIMSLILDQSRMGNLSSNLQPASHVQTHRLKIQLEKLLALYLSSTLVI